MSARSCYEKKRYPSEEVARAVAIECWRERGTDLRIYPCDECHGFHLTSQTNEPTMREGYREPRISARAEAQFRKRDRILRRRGKRDDDPGEGDWR